MLYYPTEESNQQVQTPTEEGGESLHAVAETPFEDSHASSTLAGHVDLALKSRRLDSHQHRPPGKESKAARQAPSHVGRSSYRCSTSARIRTPSVSFGG